MKYRTNVWHKWYAWHPVKINGKWHCFKEVERCLYQLDTRFMVSKHYRIIGSEDQYGFAGVQVTQDAAPKPEQEIEKTFFASCTVSEFHLHFQVLDIGHEKTLKELLSARKTLELAVSYDYAHLVHFNTKYQIVNKLILLSFNRLKKGPIQDIETLGGKLKYKTTHHISVTRQ